MLYVLNGYVMDAKENGLEGFYDLCIQDNLIKEIRVGGGFLDSEIKEADTLINATGMIICPSFCDTHSHFRDPGFEYKEDIITGANAAKRGGYTDVIMMANTKPAIDNADTLNYVLTKGKETGINLYACATVTKDLKGKELVDFDALNSTGAIAFTDDGIPIMNADLLKEAFLKVKALDKRISLHEEDKRLIKESGINHGAASDYYEIFGAIRASETKLIERDLRLAKETGAKVCIQHVSALESIEVIKKAIKEGVDVYAEITPHHFSLTEEAVIRQGSNAKMNPPLRSKRDKEALIKALKNEERFYIATDHAPHAASEKEKGLLESPSGIIGLETAFSLAEREINAKGDKGILKTIIRKLTVVPREAFGLPEIMIKEGARADIVLFKENEEWVYDAPVSKAVNTPFLNEKFKAKIKYTICNGQIVYSD